MLNNIGKSKDIKGTLCDILASVAIGLMLAVGLLAYFDVLVK